MILKDESTGELGELISRYRGTAGRSFDSECNMTPLREVSFELASHIFLLSSFRQAAHVSNPVFVNHVKSMRMSERTADFVFDQAMSGGFPLVLGAGSRCLTAGMTGEDVRLA